MNEKPTTKESQQEKKAKAAKEKTKKKMKKEEEEKPKATKPARVERQQKKKTTTTKQTKPAKAERRKSPNVEEEQQKVREAVVVKKEAAPQAPVPTPSVSVRHEKLMKMRKARGFSMPEISSAGLDMASVKRWGVTLDKRRKSMLSENAEKLKAWLKSPRGANDAGPGQKSGSRKKEENRP